MVEQLMLLQSKITILALKANISLHASIDKNLKSHLQFSLKNGKAVFTVSPLFQTLFVLIFCFVFDFSLYNWLVQKVFMSASPQDDVIAVESGV